MLKAILTSEEFEKLAEPLKEHYKQDGDNYRLDVGASGGLALENIQGLKNTINTLRKTERELTAKLEKFSGIEDPEAAIAALEKVAEIGDWKPDKKVEELIAAKEAAIKKGHQKEIDALKLSIVAAEKQLSDALIRANAAKVLTEKGGKAILLMPHILGSAKMRKTGDKYIVEIVDEAGTPRIDDAGNPMTIAGLVDEMKGNEEFAAGFDGSGSSGTGGGGAGDDGKSGKGSQQQQGGKKKVIAASDKDTVNASLQDIADGKVTVDMSR